MAEIKLEDMVPHEAEITLYPNGTTKEYMLRKVNLEDEAWMATTFGAEQLNAIFTNIDMPKIAMILFRQLKDKQDFLPRDEKTYDSNGEEIVKRVSGPELLMRAIVGKAHQLQVLNAMLKIIGAAQPVIDEEDAKKIEGAKKKKIMEKLAK